MMHHETVTSTVTLTEFLLARIAGDEEVARLATQGSSSGDGYGPWRESCDEDGVTAVSVFGYPSDRVIVRLEEYADQDHVIRWQPERVLAECEAKRRIVEAFEKESVRRDIYNRDYDSGEFDLNENDLRARLASNAHCRGLEIAMLALALPYAEHPDYRPEWRP